MFPNKGAVDKLDSGVGMKLATSSEKDITTRENLVFVDTRDCVGEQSLLDARSYFAGLGGRNPYSGKIITTTGLGVNPIEITSEEITDADSISSVDALIDGDTITISGVRGNTAANGVWVISNVNLGSTTTFDISATGNGAYTGNGTIYRAADSGYPVVDNNASYISGNEMIIYLPKKLRFIRSVSLIHTIVPRDIIPLDTYLPDFVAFSVLTDDDSPPTPGVRVATTVAGVIATSFNEGDVIDGVTLVTGDKILLKDQASSIENGIYFCDGTNPAVRTDELPTGTLSAVANKYYVLVSEGTTNINNTYQMTMAPGGLVGTNNITPTLIPNGVGVSWVSFIPQEEAFLEDNMIGFYSTPLQLFRSYASSPFAIPNKYTPPPLRLWNPTVGGATHQLKPYPQQTVPTYTSDVFNVSGETGDFYLILSGYGVYDLNDWTFRLGDNSILNFILTFLMRAFLLLTIGLNQTYRGVDYVVLIFSSALASSLSPLAYFGYGDYQRFIPGPGLGMHYQPGTSDGADPTVASIDSPVPFPNFRGNVWGPYNAPGDRFQKMGLRDTIQDLFLNGDLGNLFGTSVIKPWVSARSIPSDTSFGINFPAFSFVTFGNILDSTNPNIVNAMRISSNGFGALAVDSLGDNETISDVFLNAGGQGPDPNGVPIDGYSTTPGGGAWVETEVVDGGTGQFDDPIAAGNQFATTATEVTVGSADATNVGDDTAVRINRRTAWYDSGARNGGFKTQVTQHRNWIITELPDTNLIINISQVQRSERVQSTNQINSTAIFNCPIRLNLGTNTGTREYVESVESLLASSMLYWEKRFLPSQESVYKLSITFTSYGGKKIPIEKMLQFRRSVTLQQTYNNLISQSASLQGIVQTALSRDSRLETIFDPLDPRLFRRQKRNISLIFKVETYEHESPGIYAGVVANTNTPNSFVTSNSPY